ncbi:MAG: glutaredoxin-like protein [Actinomycetia bacterium]|nr:glutaredoxin-like protein [Actinomycetes bacterium]
MRSKLPAAYEPTDDIPESDVGAPPDESGAVDFYTRPGCGFSARLFRGLDHRGIPMRLHDIWSDPEAAATVRAAARGNETVPTIGFGGEFLVNPGVDEVLDLLNRCAPHLVPPEPPRDRGFTNRFRRSGS